MSGVMMEASGMMEPKGLCHAGRKHHGVEHDGTGRAEGRRKQPKGSRERELYRYVSFIMETLLLEPILGGKEGGLHTEPTELQNSLESGW
jgi:hypothetical protein